MLLMAANRHGHMNLFRSMAWSPLFARLLQSLMTPVEVEGLLIVFAQIDGACLNLNESL